MLSPFVLVFDAIIVVVAVLVIVLPVVIVISVFVIRRAIVVYILVASAVDVFSPECIAKFKTLTRGILNFANSAGGRSEPLTVALE